MSTCKEQKLYIIISKTNDLSKKIIQGEKTSNHLKLINIIRDFLWLYRITCEQLSCILPKLT